MKTTSKYLKLRKEYLKNHIYCQAHIPGICQGYASDIHHLYGGSERCVTLEDEKTFLAVCRTCHNWIEEHDKESRDLGLKL